MVSREYRAFYEKIVSNPSGAVDPTQTVEELRCRFEEWLAMFPPEPDVEWKTISFGGLRAVEGSAPNVDRNRILLFFHGGAYNAGSNASHRDLMGRLSRACALPVLGVDYRLAPEHPFPAALQDASASYDFLLQKGYTPSQIVLGGSSAGGGLLLALMLYLKQQGRPLPSSAVCISPWVDLTQSGDTFQSNEGRDLIRARRLESSASMYCQGEDRKDPLLSPLYGDLEGLPPLLIQVGTYELLFDQIQAFAKKAKKQKVAVTLEIWPEMLHSWPLFASAFPEGAQAIEKIGEWVRKTCTT
jgi:monoterpene epsilon-lactone hydrolase